MYTIVALGNPGREYELTRHNAGRIILSKILKSEGIELFEPSAQPVTMEMSGELVSILQPPTYMNESGRVVRQVIKREEAGSLIVIYDDIDLPLGEFKLSFGRGDGGHNGVSSIISHLDSKDFGRIRIGIAPRNFWGKVVRPEGERLPNYVLGKFSNRELTKLEEIEGKVKEAITTILKDGMEKAMNKFN